MVRDEGSSPKARLAERMGGSTLGRVGRRATVDPIELRTVVAVVSGWLRDEGEPTPARPDVAAAVRWTARTLAVVAPGGAVEVRVPPFVAVQCLEGPRHTRGTPPNVVETDPRTWLLLATGILTYTDAVESGALNVSGIRARELAHWLPLVSI